MRNLILILILFLGYQSKGQTISPQTIEKLITQKFQEINFKLYQAVIEGKIQGYSRGDQDSLLDLNSFIKRCAGPDALRFYSHRHQEISDSFIARTFYNSGLFQSKNHNYIYYAPYHIALEPKLERARKPRHGYINDSYPQFLISKGDLNQILTKSELDFIDLSYQNLTGVKETNTSGSYVSYCDLEDGQLIFERLKTLLIQYYDSITWYRLPSEPYTKIDSIPPYDAKEDKFFRHSCLDLSIDRYVIEFPLYLGSSGRIKTLTTKNAVYLQLKFHKNGIEVLNEPQIMVEIQEIKEILNNSENAMLLFILDEFSNDF